MLCFQLVLVLLCLVTCTTYAALPNEAKFTSTYSGENVKFRCDGVSANVDVDNSRVVESAKDVVTAVAGAVAAALSSVGNDPSAETVIAEANAVGRVALEVVARAVASVSAQINSPAPGCWAIAFGQARATAVAKAAVTAIAQGFAIAQQSGDVSSEAKVSAVVSSVESDVDKTVKEVALLLADGSGGGKKSGKVEVEAVARARAVNCALAQAFAAVADGVSVAQVLAQAGCTQTKAFRSIPFGVASGARSDACDCLVSTSVGVPAGCATWGPNNKKDHICYVNNPASCSCALKSSLYSGQKWRYCGPTLKELKKWLSIDDEKNKISPAGSSNGYCSFINSGKDKVVKAKPIKPSNPPPPSPPCPPFRCIGDVRDCCSQSGPTCKTSFGRNFTYLGKCSNGKDVWLGDSRSCFCP